MAIPDLIPDAVGAVVFEPNTTDPATGRWMPPPEQAAQWLGRRGLLGKNRATRLALCAAHWLAQRYEDLCEPGLRTGVVVASNFGNLDVVSRDAVTLASEGDQGLSPMDAATHSANIIAASMAIRFNWQGPSVTVCSGPRASTDALMLSRVLVGAGRCDQIILTGVEDQIPPNYLSPGERNRPLAVALVLGQGGRDPAQIDLAMTPTDPLPVCHGAAKLFAPAAALQNLDTYRRSDD